MKTKVTIKRENNFFNIFRDYKIFLKGECIGRLSNNKAFEFTIEEKSDVRLKIDWCTSNELIIEPNTNEIVLSTTCILDGWRVLIWPLYLTFFSKKYLLLERA